MPTGGRYLIAAYTYDGLGRRVSKTVSHCGSRSGAEYMYYNNKWQLLEIRTATYDGEGTLTGDKPRQQFVWGSQYIDEAVCMDVDTDGDGVCNDLGDTPAGSRRFFYCQDANYNVIALREGSTIVERYEYDPYGTCRVLTGWNDDSAGETLNVTSQSLKWLDGTLPENPIRFCGYFFDDETGIYNVRHRTYLPWLRTWGQKDPIGHSSNDLSLYLYVRDNPVGYIDPSGEVIKCVGLSGWIAGVLGVSGSASFCWDSCGKRTVVVCGGGGVGFGGGIGLQGSVGQGCLCPGSSCQVTAQVGVGVVGGGFSIVCGGGGSIGGGGGPGAGGAVTIEGCYTF